MSKAWCHRALLSLVIASIATTTACVHNPDEGGKIRHDLPLDSLCDGDLVYRQGLSPESQVVMQLDSAKGQYSHIGIAINDHGTWKVVHATPGEHPDDARMVIIEPIDTFFLSTRAEHGAIMRLKGCSTTTAHQAAIKAATKRGTPFDFHYNWTDTSRLYCTELISVVYNSAGVNILQSNNRIKEDNSTNTIVFPSDIASNDSLKVIFSF